MAECFLIRDEDDFFKEDEEAGDPLAAVLPGDRIFSAALELPSELDAGLLLMVNLIPPEAVAVILLVTP